MTPSLYSLVSITCVQCSRAQCQLQGWINHVRFADTWGLREHVFAGHPIPPRDVWRGSRKESSKGGGSVPRTPAGGAAGRRFRDQRDRVQSFDAGAERNTTRNPTPLRRESGTNLPREAQRALIRRLSHDPPRTTL